MEYAITHSNLLTHVRLTGQFTFTDHQKFRRIIEDVRERKSESVKMDFTAVDFIDSAGLGMLLLLREECHNLHIALSLHGAHGQVEKIFMISKFDELFRLDS